MSLGVSRGRCWSIGAGLSALIYRRWSADAGLPALVCRRWSADASLPTLVYRRWSADAGLSALVCRRWSIGAGLPALVDPCWLAGCRCWQTEGGTEGVVPPWRALAPLLSVRISPSHHKSARAVWPDKGAFSWCSVRAARPLAPLPAAPGPLRRARRLKTHLCLGLGVCV